MRAPSRNLPQAEQQTFFGKTFSWIFLLLFILLLITPGLVWWPFFILPVLVLYFSIQEHLRNARHAKVRSDENICTFSRSFDCRKTNTWIIRAVYEEFSCFYPVRATDKIDKFMIDPEDYQEMLAKIASRAGIHLEKHPGNYQLENIETIGDLVVFLNRQPNLDNPPHVPTHHPHL